MRTPIAMTLTLLAGGLGFAAGYLVSRQKYYTLADREVESIKKMLPEHDARLLALHGIVVDSNVKDIPSNGIKTSATITPETLAEGKDRIEEELKSKPLAQTNYANMTKTYKSTTPKELRELPTNKSTNLAKVTIITEEEADKLDEYPEDLYYYKDGVVADRDDNPVTNFESLVGPISLWEKVLKSDCYAYVRNDKTNVVYCIHDVDIKWKNVASGTNHEKSLLDVSDESDDD